MHLQNNTLTALYENVWDTLHEMCKTSAN